MPFADSYRKLNSIPFAINVESQYEIRKASMCNGCIRWRKILSNNRNIFAVILLHSIDGNQHTHIHAGTHLPCWKVNVFSLFFCFHFCFHFCFRWPTTIVKQAQRHLRAKTRRTRTVNEKRSESGLVKLRWKFS